MRYRPARTAPAQNRGLASMCAEDPAGPDEGRDEPEVKLRVGTLSGLPSDIGGMPQLLRIAQADGVDHFLPSLENSKTAKRCDQSVKSLFVLETTASGPPSQS